MLLSAGPLLISEFVAINNANKEFALADSHGHYPDWIEIHNPTDSDYNLDGWYLTDDEADLTKWRFPNRPLASGDYLVVFASNEDPTAGSELHTNFQLSGEGEFLALVQPDGTTIAHDYAPRFPGQKTNISYGIGGTTTQSQPLVPENTMVRMVVPTNDSLDNLLWTTADFDDSAWAEVDSGIGYETETGWAGFNAKINFQPAAADVPPGYVVDSGAAFGSRGQGLSYGWLGGSITAVYKRYLNADQRYDTTAYLSPSGVDKVWEIAVPNGTYDVFAVFGDPWRPSTANTIDIEGTVLTDPDGADNYDDYSVSVIVTDGRLTIQPAEGAANPKILFVEISSEGKVAYDGLIATDVKSEMLGKASSVYYRKTFNVADPAARQSLTLQVKYDDGFVAYLNGVKIAERNAPGSPGFDSTATTEHPDGQAILFEEIDVSAHLGLLKAEDNVLAIHGLNDAVDSTDFLIVSQLMSEVEILHSEQYFTTPTPREENQEGALGRVKDTRFSVDRGFHDEPFWVEIATATEDAEIRYTIDGSKPTATTGSVYSDAIRVDRTTTLRAAAFLPGYVETNVDTHTYIFLDDVLTQTGVGFPRNWGHHGPDYAMDPRVVNDRLYRDTIRDDMKDVPTFSLVMDQDDWFKSGGQGIYTQGKGVEREVSMELIHTDGTKGFQIDGSVMIQGGSSTNRWKVDKLSMRVKFKEPYGPAKLNYPLYGDSAVEEFNTIVVDAMMNNNWLHPDHNQRKRGQYVRDQFVSNIQIAMGGQSTRGFYAHLYLNGLYWGVYWLHERPDENFTASYYGGDPDDYYVLKHKNSTVVHPNINDPGTTSADVSAARADFNQLFSIARSGLSTPSRYAQLQQHLDIDDFIKYMITNFYTGNTDWDHHNWYASRNHNDPDGRWRFHSWDAEHVLKSVTTNMTGENNSYAATELHQRLSQNAEYKLLFADYVHQYFFNDGLLTAENAGARYEELVGEVDRAVVGDSARWGDNREDNDSPYVRYTRDDFVIERDSLLDDYFPRRSGIVLNQLVSRGLYPQVTAPAFNQHGGDVPAGFGVTMSAPSGRIYYTVDGSDPRLPDGNLSATALAWDGSPRALAESTRVKARVLSNGNWSALNEAPFYVGPQAAGNLAITEINYNPYVPTIVEKAAGWDDNDAFEFIELRNVGSETIDVIDVEFVRGVTFAFSGESAISLDPGESTVVVRNLEAFTLRYGDGVNVAGQYIGDLANSGDRISLLDHHGDPIHDFYYNDGGDWPGRSDGAGSALELRDPAGDYNSSDNWRSSSEYGGTPGSLGEGPRNDVLVNEVLSHTDLPDFDAIELINTTEAAIDVGGWYLSDYAGESRSARNYKKFRIPDGTIIVAGGLLVFDERDFNPNGDWNPEAGQRGVNEFALSGAHGDDVWLLEADASGNLVRFVDHVEFGGAANGEAFGRSGNSYGKNLYPMFVATLGEPNSGPRLGEVVISEVMVAPLGPGGDADPNDFEFVEIHNASAEEVRLTDWRIRKGIDFDFDSWTRLAPGETLVVVPFDIDDSPDNVAKAAAFRDYYGIDETVEIVGGYSGKLGDDGNRVQLQRPDSPPADEPDYTPHLVADEVVYGIADPWPEPPIESDASLNRRTARTYGNSADSWQADVPTPGSVDPWLANPYPGDANLDGTTDVRDFMIWNVNKFTNGTGFTTGDFTGDGITDVRDFMTWNVHKFTAAPAPAPADAVHMEVIEDGSAVADDLLGDLSWLSEWEVDKTTADSDENVKTAVDKLLATYWP